MVLLTGGQVSMAISSTIVFLFTSALFLAGYVLQQQTVKNLQAAIRPRLPKPTARTTVQAPRTTAVVFGNPAAVLKFEEPDGFVGLSASRSEQFVFGEEGGGNEAGDEDVLEMLMARNGLYANGVEGSRTEE